MEAAKVLAKEMASDMIRPWHGNGWTGHIVWLSHFHAAEAVL